MEADAQTTRQPFASSSKASVPIAIGLLICVAGAYIYASRPGPPLEGWAPDFAAAMQQAQAEHKNVLVVFHLPGCAPCRQMERSVLPDPKVTEALASLVPVRVDLSQAPELGERYQVWDTPAYLILDPQGRLVARDKGRRSVDQFVAFLSRARP